MVRSSYEEFLKVQYSFIHSSIPPDDLSQEGNYLLMYRTLLKCCLSLLQALTISSPSNFASLCAPNSCLQSLWDYFTKQAWCNFMLCAKGSSRSRSQSSDR